MMRNNEDLQKRQAFLLRERANIDQELGEIKILLAGGEIARSVSAAESDGISVGMDGL